MLLSAMLLVSSSISVSAAPKVNVDSYLKEQGFPQDYIIQLTPEQKEFFYKNKAEFVSRINQKGNLSETKGQSLQANSFPGLIAPLEMNNWSATLSVVRYLSPSSGISKHAITYNWTWNQRANFNLTDKFGIAWTDDWDIVNGSARSNYAPSGVDSNGSYCSTSSTKTGSDTYAAGAGVGWSFDIKHDFTAIGGNYCETSKHAGWGMVEVVKAHNGSGKSDSCSASATYFHKQGAINGSLGFDGTTPVVSLSPSFNYDKAVDTPHQWYWKHEDYI
ncbi:hypothetical protein SAMN05444162_3635 [Paenibacillaceae bacterium GAS479]|nr:hypothetical protein SAMN05444162_3635 [Paenibacillaceae bacterium GAS479]